MIFLHATTCLSMMTTRVRFKNPNEGHSDYQVVFWFKWIATKSGRYICLPKCGYCFVHKLYKKKTSPAASTNYTSALIFRKKELLYIHYIHSHQYQKNKIQMKKVSGVIFTVTLCLFTFYAVNNHC